MCQIPLTMAVQAGELFWWPSVACPCCHQASLELRGGWVWAMIFARREFLFNYIFFRVWFGRHGACLWTPSQGAQSWGPLRVLRAVLSMRTLVSAVCRKAGHVLEAVADPGCCSIWQVRNHPLSPRAFLPYAGVTSMFGVKGL